MRPIRKATLVAGLAVASLVAVSCGGDTVYITAEPTTTAVAKTTTTVGALATGTRPQPSYQTGTYDPAAYDAAIWSDANDFWWLYTTDELLNFGLIICSSLDSGMSIQDVGNMILDSLAQTGTLGYAEAMAVVTAAALAFLCPEHYDVLATL